MPSNNLPRILQLTSTADIGGTEQNLLRYFENCDCSRFQYMLATLQSSGPFLEQARALGIQTLGLPGSNPFSPSVRKTLRTLLSEHPCALIHGYGLRAEILGRAAAVDANVPAYVSAIRSTDPWRRTHHVWLDRWSARNNRVDLFISNSEAGRQSRITREKFPADKIITIPNGIQFPESDSHSSEPEPEQHPKIIVIGNLRKAKGHLDMIAVLSDLVLQFPQTQMLFVGRDDSHGVIQQAAENADVAQHITFTGFVDNPTTLLQQADIFCMPSHWEGMPTALLEAMACRKAIVATRVGGIPELVRDEKEALLVDSKNPNALREALIRLIENPTLADQLAEAAFCRAQENFSLAQTISAIENAYAKLIDIKY